MRKTGLYALGFLVISLLLLGVVVPALAEDGPVNVQVDHAGMDPRTGPIDPAFRTDGRFESPHSRDVLDSGGNEESNGNFFSIAGNREGLPSGDQDDGKTSWWKDHGEGLLLGALEGLGIAVGVVAIGALLALSAPVVGAMALGALIGTAAYGAIAGVSNYNPWEAAVNGLIGAVSGGIGAGLGAVSAGVKTLVIGAVDAVGSGLASAASYGLNTSNPTTEGYLSSFGVGAVIGGVTFGVGRLMAGLTGIGQKAALGTVAREERVAAQTVVETNSQVAKRLDAIVEGYDAPKTATLGGEFADDVERQARAVAESGEATAKPALPSEPPSSKTYARPSAYRKGMRENVWAQAKGEDGHVRDPKTGKVMADDEPWDMGHKPGYEFRKHQLSAAQRGITRKQFLNEHNNPDHYRPELPGSNRSHLLEDQTSRYRGD